jgi:hypothetical protein
MKTFVYVISGDHGRQKIGVTDDPRQRIRTLQTGSPYNLKFEFVGETENGAAGAIEVEAHFMLAQHKSPGGDEWFTVPPDVAVTAVMAAAHRLGYRVKPVDAETTSGKSYGIGAPGWHQAANVLAAIPLLLAGGWLIWSFDQGQIGAIATIVCVAIAIGLFKLARYGLIQIGNSLIRFDHFMHPDGRP